MKRLHWSAALLVVLGLQGGNALGYGREETIADVLTGVVPLGAYGLTWVKDDPQGRRQWWWSTATSLAINTGLRVAFNQTDWGERPNGHPYGFPSGHTSFIVSGAAFMQERYGMRYGIPAYLASAYIGYVRVDTGHHRWRDIIAAGALSWAVGRWFVTPYENQRIAPLVGPDVLGLRWEYVW
jgi:membrane-associated phospholipid phosphatase